MKEEMHLWILERPNTTSTKIGKQSVSIAVYINI